MIKETLIHSLEQYSRYVEQYKGKAFFRGQANKYWAIVPSLFRDNVEQESQSIKKSIADNINDIGIVPTIFHMQHYGTPTRLIDLTISPYSALFFALNDRSQKTQDGIVYVFNKADTIQSKDIRLVKLAELLLADFSYMKCPPELLDFAQNDHIIQYEYAYSYTNERAMLQGGTSLWVGLGYTGDALTRMKPCCFDKLIIEKIIIPHECKISILSELKALGYCSEILYGEWESLQTTDTFDLVQEKFDVTPKSDFNKIVAQFRVSNILFDKDVLTNKIVSLYNQYFRKYGHNARIWLFIFFDQKDRDMANWICRTEWKEYFKWQFQWNKKYYNTRLSSINEEISFEELYSLMLPLIHSATDHMNLINSTIRKNGFDECSPLLKDGQKKAQKTSRDANNIQYTSTEYEPFARAGLAFINDVERLYTEMTIFIDRGETNIFLTFWCNVLLEQCLKSQARFKDVSDQMKIAL